MTDNPYQPGAALSDARKPIGRKLLFGFLLLAAGEITQLVVRFISPGILSDLMTSPAGIKPSDIARHHQFWTFVSGLGAVARLIGVAVLIHAGWRRLSAMDETHSTKGK